MRNYKYILTVFMTLLLAWVVVACEEQDMDRTFEGPYFVRFTDSSLTFKESYNQTISVRVHNAGPQLGEPITVRYAISGTAREGKDYAFEGTKGTVTIPANQSFGEIKLKLINNANNILESQTVVFTLTDVEPASLRVGFGKEGLLGKSITFTIEDDCLLSGNYTGVRQNGAYANLLGITPATATLRDIAITSTDCKTYTITNWNIGLPDLFGYNAIKPSFTFVDTGDNTLTIPTQSNSELGGDTLSGTGSWNPQNRQLSFNLRWKANLRTNAGKDTTLTITFPFTYTPQ
ncbi:Calx-beta domain-containing protein [Larkinella insperata]|uniref:Calx-beta domain-containing protein n=1 Tax=Larkinella insperata TaxID=332158 RepID=A0ABW3PZG6_9BACT|nr:Calx-beta domain-containing protein [Larkinella insperata]